MKILIADVSAISDLEASVYRHVLRSLPDMAKHLLFLSFQRDSSEDSDNWSNEATEIFRPNNTIVVMNKVDLVNPSDSLPPLAGEIMQTHHEGAEICYMSCKTREGVDHFMKELKGMLKKM